MNDNNREANAWSDFNDAEAQQSGFNLIPKGALVPVLMTLKPGGHYDASQGWSDGYPTQSPKSGAVYLAAEFVITGGEYAKRKMWSNIGLYSPKGPTWTQMGRTFVRAALNSARNVLPQDNSPQAAAARRFGIDKRLVSKWYRKKIIGKVMHQGGQTQCCAEGCSGFGD